jgi:hypothetical protein
MKLKKRKGRAGEREEEMRLIKFSGFSELSGLKLMDLIRLGG